GAQPEWVLPCATGRIGVQVPRARLLRGVRAAAAALAAGGFADAAEAITTTDAFPKTAVRRLRLGRRKITVAALGKGAGMIAPNMATLLVFVVTDARLTAAAAQTALRDAVDATLNAISVDGDTSTNDTVLLLASGAAGNRAIGSGSQDHSRFTEALTGALDGEGATKLVEVVVRGAPSPEAAVRVARAVGGSTLCKTAFHGADPNWGRF